MPGRAADRSNERGNSVSNFQGCHFSGESLPTTIHFNTLSSGERTRDRGDPPCNQSKSTKQISSEGKVQNGGAPYRSLSSTQGRLYDETRLAGSYYAVPIHPELRKYLRFHFKGTTSEFRCLPFGPPPPESSPESSVRLLPNCVQRECEQSSTWTIFS